jgi:hypothetical protein
MSRSQRHAVYIKGVDASGKGVAEGVAAPVYVQQFLVPTAFVVPLGPPSGPLKGSSLAGFPPTALPAPKAGEEVLGRGTFTAVGGELTDPGQLNLTGNPHYISLPPAAESTPPEPPITGPAPVVSALMPDTAVLGDPDFTLSVRGTGFTEESVIMFAGQPEPIVFVSDTEVTTVVKPSLGWGAVAVQVSVKNPDGQESNALAFVFTEPVAARKTKAKK